MTLVDDYRFGEDLEDEPQSDPLPILNVDKDQLWETSNLDEPIILAAAERLQQSRPTNITLTYRQLFDFLSSPAQDSHKKEGSAIFCGNFGESGTKKLENFQTGYLACLDADSRYEKNHRVVTGAPDPEETHKALCRLNITHCLHTTYSHLQKDKGNRYRIYFPYKFSTKLELSAAVTYLVKALQDEGVPLYLTSESTSPASLWQLPRISAQGQPYYYASYVGVQLKSDHLAEVYKEVETESVRLPTIGNLVTEEPDSLFAQANIYLPVGKQLEDAGYRYEGQNVQKSADGVYITVSRWSKPDHNDGGISVFHYNSKDYLYSFYNNSPFTPRSMLDAGAVFFALRGVSRDQGIPLLCQELETAIVEEMNEEFPCILEHGANFKVCNVIHEPSGEIEYSFMAWSSFNLLMHAAPAIWSTGQDQMGNAIVKKKTRSEYWKTCPLRKQYNGTRFEPYHIASKNTRDIYKGGKLYYNLFPGWTVRPRHGDWSKLEWHLKNVICAGEADQYEYLLDWFCHLVQFPQEKPGVAVVVQGKKGVGKSIVFDNIASRLGAIGAVLGHANQISGQFNSHLSRKLFVVLEESFWSGDPQAEGVMKHLITDTKTTYEAKGVDPKEGVNYTRVIMITNNDWAAPVSEDERRFFMPTVRSYIPGISEGEESAYFGNLIAEIKSGGVDAFFHFLKGRKIVSRDITRTIRTDKLRSQLSLSLKKEEGWLYSLLLTGALGEDGMRLTEAGAFVPMDTLTQSLYRKLDRNSRMHAPEAILMSLLRKRLPTSTRVQQTVAQGVMVRFLPLSKCREEYNKNTKVKVDWPENAEIFGE